MQTLEELKNEELLNKKIRQKRRIRGVLIIVNALLIAYASYLSVVSIIDLVKENKEKDQGDVITLLDKTVDQSLELYDEYISNKVDVVDVAIYGNYLLTSSSRVTHNSFESQGAVTLVKVVGEGSPNFNEPKLTYTLNNCISSQIDLFSLEQGDYLICKDYDVTKPNIKNVYHYTGEEMLKETIYSLPESDGTRKKIEIKGKNSSPALVISVTNVSACPESYHDFIILNQLQEENLEPSWIKDLKDNYKVKVVNDLVDAYKEDATYCISLVEGTSLIKSNYVESELFTSSSLITSESLEGLDSNNEIRELGGYLFNAGYGASKEEVGESISQASIAIKNNILSTKKGKLTVVVGHQVEEQKAYSSIKDIFYIK